MKRNLITRISSIAGAVVLGMLVAPFAIAGGPYHFYSVTPCRLVDTRATNPQTPIMLTNPPTVRTFTVKGNCGVPMDAKAVSLNVATVQPVFTGSAWIALYPGGTTHPGNSTMNIRFFDNVLANETVVELGSNATDDLALTTIQKKGSLHLVLDVLGYYK